jgi:serine/threonine protein kinase
MTRALDFTCQICNALDHAHRQNVLHRDLRPANIMVADNGLVKVADFGTSRILEAAVRVDVIAPRPPALDGVAEEIAERRAQAAVQGLGESDLARIRALLEVDGLATDHLAIPLAERDAAVGMERLAVPQARRHAPIGVPRTGLGGGD